MKEQKKKRKAKAVTIINSDYYNSETKQILEGINDEYFKAQAGLKKQFILKAAKLLEDIGLPKKAICAELVQHIRFASERMIRKTLTPDYTRDYDNDNQIGTSADIEAKKIMEQDSKKVAQNYDIDVKEDVPDSPIYNRLLEKIEMLEDERDYYMDQCKQLKQQVRLLEQQLLTIQK